MNLQEAVGWLLENNAMPFQSTANYAGNTEIAMSTLINPSPAKVRVGSIIFFADSKVSTVIGVTSNSFICSAEYNDLVDDVVYVTNVAINASGHLICTLSNGNTIDAGLIKQVASFSINGSQHLIVTYNDGSTSDLGAIFSGNITISGNLTVTGGISGNAIAGTAITGDSIIENMSNYAFYKDGTLDWTPVYAGVVKNGNKITFVVFGSYTYHAGDGSQQICHFNIPEAVGQKLIPYTLGAETKMLDARKVEFYDNRTSSKEVFVEVNKILDTRIGMNIMSQYLASLTDGTTYLFRYEVTFLLADPLNS